MKFHLIVLLSASFLTLPGAFAQQQCDLESYYSNTELFKTDTVYNNVEIDGKYVTIKVLSDRRNEYLETYEESEYGWGNYAPKTLVMYDESDRRMIYVKRMSDAIPEFEKTNKDLSKEGKLYLRWFSSGGGSGYLLESYYVHLEEGKIVLDELFTTNELSFILHRKDDSEIYVLQGIWDMAVDEETGDFESHFADHKYEIFCFRFGENGLEGTSLGVTTHKYASLDEGKSVLEIFREIQRKEKILPSGVKIEELVGR